jgi:hypothetical protein
MKVLKSAIFSYDVYLTKFVSDYSIQREDIISIVTPGNSMGSEYVIFFYIDPNVVLPERKF